MWARHHANMGCIQAQLDLNLASLNIIKGKISLATDFTVNAINLWFYRAIKSWPESWPTKCAARDE